MKRLPLLLFVILLSLPTSPAGAGYPGFMLARMGSINGQLFVDDKPLPNALVALFPVQRGLPPITTEMTSIPETLVYANSEGKFSVKIMPDINYYLGMVVREDRKVQGPPRPGEPYFFAVQPSGALRQFSIGYKENLEVGRIDGARPETFKEISDTFLVRGTVADNQGKPAPGMLVFAKDNMNHERPDYISQRTAADGTFTLRVPAGRNYYLFARPTIGFAKPSPGEYMGVYGVKSANGLISPVISGVGGPPPVVGGKDDATDNNPKPVTGVNNEVVSGVDIVMYAIPDAEELKTSLQGKGTLQIFELGAKLNNIYFALDNDRLEERSFTELNKWATFLAGSPNINIEISGHTDSTGSPSHNRMLSEKRAVAVAKYLKDKGVAAQRLKTVGFGADHPVDDNNTDAGREKNRRVEIRFVQ